MSSVETLNHCHVIEERGWLFHSEDTQTTEDEYLQLLYALVICLKPLAVLETGTFKGYGTSAMAKGLRYNGTGFLTSIEAVPLAAGWGREMLKVNGVSDWARIVESDSLEFLGQTSQRFDFALFDSQIPLRVKELTVCLDRGLLRTGAMCALHDTSRLRTITPGCPDPNTPQFWKELEAEKRIKFLEFPLSRGLVLAQVI
jgi:predicted O-methyltransferase YrrM